MVVVSHLFLFLRKNFRGRFDSCESNLPLFGTIYFPIAPFVAPNALDGIGADVLRQYRITTGFILFSLLIVNTSLLLLQSFV